jgi:arylsulfatase A-like enzyme
MLNSRYPTQLGLVEEPAPANTRFQARGRRTQLAYTPPSGVRTLPAALGEAGFRTVAFVNQPFINIHGGFLQGFGEWCYPTAEERVRWHDTSQPIPTTVFPDGTELGRADSVLVEEFVDWIEDNADSKPFVWLHLLRPHWPYRPPERFLPDHVDGWREVPKSQRYDGEIRSVDDHIGQVLAAIDKHIGLERSLIVFTSDHGEAFDEHGGVEHGHSLHREVVHVPLIIAAPQLGSGQRIDEYVSAIDIAPTILDLAGVNSVATDGWQGATLGPVIAGEPNPRVAYSEGMLYGGTERSLLFGGYKLMYQAEGRERDKLFNLASDPYETVDLSGRFHTRAADMRRVMDDLHARLLEDYQRGVGSDDVPIASEEDERVLRSLKALGYLDSD